ncbi:MAG: TAT-variant-translocated molybdopterin oxidoreductase [Phycisphaerales bacterium]|nr:TAT-variant-translocated molybdopterin oxidoreductase [Phycisphaerales bacterium]
MSTIDHTRAEQTRELPTVNGRKMWRSLDEIAGTPEFQSFVEQEFPAGASQLLSTSRRDFLSLMGASVALAGAATIPGCRRPDHKILAYSRNVPEEIIPGKPLYYATSMPLPGGGAEGLLVETHEGRPTKIEGNPLHPNNRGRASTFALASIMEMYDPDRLKNPRFFNQTRGPLDASWDDFKAWAPDHFRKHDASQGAGLAFVVEKKTSPSRDEARAAVLKRWPKARWVAWDSLDTRAEVAGARLAFGAPMRELIDFSKARVVVSLGRDFVNHSHGYEPHALAHARGFAATRRLNSADDPMSRLYVIESGFSLAGGQADHRLRLSPSRITAFAVGLANTVLARATTTSGVPDAVKLRTAIQGVAVPPGPDFDQAFLNAVADDLFTEGRGASVIVAGPGQPAEVHALVHALNAAMGNVGKTISYIPMADEEAADSFAALADLAKAIDAGQVTSAVCIGVNPAYDAPADIGFASALGKLEALVTLTVDHNETSALATWSLNAAHYLESWGDTESYDGTIAPIQPMIAPLYEPAMSDIELLAYLAGDERADGYALVRAAWKARLKPKSDAEFEKTWRRALHDGVVSAGAGRGTSAEVDFTAIGAAAAKLTLAGPPSEQAMEVVFDAGLLRDGRYANIPWLQELPQTGTRVVWDNPALVSPKTAEKLGLTPDPYTVKYPHGRIATLTLNSRSVEVPVWILPGMADDTIILTLGYGRAECGLVGRRVGVNVNVIRTTAASRAGRGATLAAKPGESYPISSTQNHWSLEGRTSIVREIDLPAWRKFAGQAPEPHKDSVYGTEQGELNIGEKLGELSHTPPNISIYDNPLNRSKADAAKDSTYAKGPQWAMTIDLSTCTGCGACTIACQAENNIAVVGKKEVAKGREMAWIRVDRYFLGDDFNNPSAMVHQPVACVQCENAPCETVCPVNATTHGPEGINYMVYNRCIGTRYCANNCPYKVRRFNFFDYGVTKFNGGYIGRDAVESIAPDRGGVTGSGEGNKINVNLIPPRLRDKLDEISRMQKNPDVTVRSRGVMEKCTYCIQRINAARHECRIQDLDHVPDGFFQTACQQACPSEAIVFGDYLDTQTEYKEEGGGVRKGSRVLHTRRHQRSYALLGFLNTRPRTSHMVRVLNPNPALCSAERKASWETPFGHHGGEHGPEHPAPPGDTQPHTEAPAEKHGMNDRSFFLDRRKFFEDGGYAFSLKVLTGVGV